MIARRVSARTLGVALPLLGLVVSGAAGAAPLPAHSGGQNQTLRTIMNLRSENAILKQELANALLRRQLMKARGLSPGAVGGSSASGGAAGGVFTPTPKHIGKTLPRIRTILGANDRVRAVLEARNGAILSVRDGSLLPGGLHVERISSRAVWVSLGGRSRPLLLHWMPAHIQQSTKLSGGGYLPTANLRNLLLDHPPVGGPPGGIPGGIPGGMPPVMSPPPITGAQPGGSAPPAVPHPQAAGG